MPTPRPSRYYSSPEWFRIPRRTRLAAIGAHAPLKQWADDYQEDTVPDYVMEQFHVPFNLVTDLVRIGALARVRGEVGAPVEYVFTTPGKA